MDEEEIMYLIKNAELHIRSANTELELAERAIDAMRRAF